MTSGPSRACRRHRATLLDFVDRPRRDPAMAAALDHLDRCPSCRSEVAEVAQVVTVLRRMGREVENLEAPGDAWLGLRQRITQPADVWRWRSTLGGMVVSALLVAVVIIPGGLTTGSSLSPSASIAAAEALADARLEEIYLASRRASAHGPIDGSPVAGRSLPLLRTEAVAFRKEVKLAGPRPRLI